MKNKDFQVKEMNELVSFYLIVSFQLYCPVLTHPKSIRILGCFKLNPFEHLKLSFDSSPDEVKKQYRKV